MADRKILLNHVPFVAVTEWVTWFGFVLVMALGQFSPGPDMILLTRTALAEGGRQGIRMALGIASGLVFHAALAVFASDYLMGLRGPLGRVGVLVAGAYLLYLSVRIFPWRGASPLVAARQGAGPSKAYLRGLLCNLLNPKVALILAVVTAPFLARGEGPLWPWMLWATIVLEGALLWSLWALVLQHPTCLRLYQKARRVIDAAFALALAVLAIWLLLTLGQ